MLSHEIYTRKYELWLIIPGQRSELLNEYGLYESQGEAQRMASAVADWFHLGTWYDSVLDRLGPETQDDLFAMRQGFKSDCVPLGSIRLQVRASVSSETAYGTATAFSGPGDDDADDDDHLPDTDLEPPDIVFALGSN